MNQNEQWRERLNRTPRPIDCEHKYQEALAEARELAAKNPEPGSADDAELYAVALALTDYERRTLPISPGEYRSSNPTEDAAHRYSREELEKMLVDMQGIADSFYFRAHACCHQFGEFTGFMNQWLSLCRAGYALGHDFTGFAPVPPNAFHGGHARYLGEKFECIFGELFRGRPDVIGAFCSSAFGYDPEEPVETRLLRRIANSKQSIRELLELPNEELERAAEAATESRDEFVRRMMAGGKTMRDLLNLPAMREATPQHIADLAESHEILASYIVGGLLEGQLSREQATEQIMEALDSATRAYQLDESGNLKAPPAIPSAAGERCKLCGEQAELKIAEETDEPRHPFTAYVCRRCFARVMFGKPEVPPPGSPSRELFESRESRVVK